MRELTLVRHAKSSWDDPEQVDRDRPLAPRGRRAARRLAARLRELGVLPGVVLCSPAARARQTLDLLLPGLGDQVEVRFEDELYGASADELLDRVRRLPKGARSALVVGHNPGLQELAVLLAREGSLREQARERFPTAALATLRLPHGGWSDLGPQAAELVSFKVPRDLR